MSVFYRLGNLFVMLSSLEIFSYVEGKGMEMQIQVMPPDKQTAFMLSALRELREGNQKKKEEGKDNTSTNIIGPLLGPAIPADQGPPPPEKDIPDNLEFITFEIDLPVGFQRLRWAILSQKSRFFTDAFFAEANNTECVFMAIGESCVIILNSLLTTCNLFPFL